MRDHGASAHLRTALLIIVAIAATLLGIIAADHSDIAHVAPSVSESLHQVDASITEQPLVASVIGGGCLLLAACCVVALAVRRTSPAPRVLSHTPSPTLPVIQTRGRRRLRPSLQQLSVNRT